MPEESKIFHKFKVRQNATFPQCAEVWLDDKKLHVTGFTLEHYATEIAHLTLEMDVETDIDYNKLDFEIISAEQERLEHELKSNREAMRTILQSLEEIEKENADDARKDVGHLKKYVDNHMKIYKLDGKSEGGDKNATD